MEKLVDKPTEPRKKDLLLIKRIIGAIDRKVEFGGQMAALSLLGHPSWNASHRFAPINPWKAVSNLALIFSKPTYESLDGRGDDDMREDAPQDECTHGATEATL